MEKVLIGKAVNVVGLRGEIRVYNYSDGIEIYELADELYIGKELYKVQNVRLQKNMVVLKVEGIDDRNAAEKTRGREIFVSEEYLPQLPEGVHYVRDLIGMEVFLENGSRIGTVKNIIQNTAQDVYDIETEEGSQVLIPGVPEFLIDINEETRRITVRVIEGMLPSDEALEA